jgi:hypothetical protein
VGGWEADNRAGWGISMETDIESNVGDSLVMIWEIDASAVSSLGRDGAVVHQLMGCTKAGKLTSGESSLRITAPLVSTWMTRGVGRY